jgi:hypothetical protein
MGLKTIYSALLSGKMEQPFYQLNALPKSFLTPTEIMHFEWQRVYINLSDEACLNQIDKRRFENPERAKTDNKKMFEQVTKYFIEPQSEKEFNIIV